MHAEKENIKKWLEVLSVGNAKKKGLWKRLYSFASRPERSRVEVGIEKINKYTKEGDIAIIPGKVLGPGELDHKVTIAAIEFSKPAEEALRKAGCEIKGIEELYKQMEGNQKVSAKIIV
ncbi:MAG: 50S ribosomal protein L18e [Candidatus Micrarchaeaceae archaeon]